jgi:hypothetical protein
MMTGMNTCSKNWVLFLIVLQLSSSSGFFKPFAITLANSVLPKPRAPVNKIGGTAVPLFAPST